MNSNIQKTVRYHKAFKEVYLLINDLSSDLYIKIPKSFIKTIKENMDESYDISIDKLNTEGMMKETEAVMSLVFRDFLCSDKLNKKLTEYDNNHIEQEITRYNKIFENENIFEKNNIETQKYNLKENTSLIIVKEKNIFMKILNKIKNILKLL